MNHLYRETGYAIYSAAIVLGFFGMLYLISFREIVADKEWSVINIMFGALAAEFVHVGGSWAYLIGAKGAEPPK